MEKRKGLLIPLHLMVCSYMTASGTGSLVLIQDVTAGKSCRMSSEV